MKDNSRSIKRSKVFAAIYRSSVWKKGVKEEEMAGCRIAPPMCNHACDLMPLNPIISTRSSQNKNWFMVCRYSQWKSNICLYIISGDLSQRIVLSARFGWSFLEKYPPTSCSTGNRWITPFGPLLWQAKADTDLTLSASPQGVKSLGQNHGRCVWSDGENICWAAMLDVMPSIKVANSSWWVSSCLLGYTY